MVQPVDRLPFGATFSSVSAFTRSVSRSIVVFCDAITDCRLPTVESSVARRLSDSDVRLLIRSRLSFSALSVSRTRVTTYRSLAIRVSLDAVIGLSLETCKRLLRIFALASSALTSLMSRELMATSCIKLSFCALAVSSSASLRSVSAEVPQAANAKTRATDVNLSVFIRRTPLSRRVKLGLTDAAPATARRYLWLQLPRMEGKLLSGQAREREVARVLRPTIGHSRDQLHFLSHAQRQNDRRLGCGDPSDIHLCAEGAATYHALRAPAKH